MESLYLISSELQKEEVENYCFGTCGKVNMGIIEFGGFLWWPCWKKDCFYQERESPPEPHDLPPHGKVNIILRKLKGE
jgi:hypothetical protein